MLKAKKAVSTNINHLSSAVLLAVITSLFPTIVNATEAIIQKTDSYDKLVGVDTPYVIAIFDLEECLTETELQEPSLFAISVEEDDGKGDVINVEARVMGGPASNTKEVQYVSVAKYKAALIWGGSTLL